MTADSSGRWSVRGALAVAVLAGLGGFAFLAVSILPFELVKTRLDALAADGDVEWFTPDEFARRARGLRLLGSALVVVAVGLFAKRHAMARGLAFVLGSFGAYCRDAAKRAVGTMRSETGMHTALFLGIFAIGAAIRVLFLFQPIRYDEAFTYLNFASRPWAVALSDYSWPNNHIFHTALVRASYLLFGDGVWAIRLPAFVAGALVPPATYLVVRSFYDRRGALMAMGLAAASSPLVLYSTNARGYTILTVFALVLLALARDQKVKAHPGGWIAIVVVSALGAFTLPVMLYPFGIAVGWLLATAWLDPAGGATFSAGADGLTESGASGPHRGGGPTQSGARDAGVPGGSGNRLSGDPSPGRWPGWARSRSSSTCLPSSTRGSARSSRTSP